MATNRTTDKVTIHRTGDSPRRSLFHSSRLFNRNGHEKQPVAPVKPQGPPKSVWREYFESAVVTVIMALFGMTFIVQAVKVPTGSMQNTITIGDHLLVNKFIFAPGQVAAVSAAKRDQTRRYHRLQVSRQSLRSRNVTTVRTTGRY